jgi:hypothetical protein
VFVEKTRYLFIFVVDNAFSDPETALLPFTSMFPGKEKELLIIVDPVTNYEPF